MTVGHNKHLCPLQLPAAALKSDQRVVTANSRFPPLEVRMRLQQTPPLGAIPSLPVELRRLNQGELVPDQLVENQTKPHRERDYSKPDQNVLGKTSGAEEDNRKEAKEAFEAEAASQDHGHVQDQPEQVLGGVGGGLPRHNHC